MKSIKAKIILGVVAVVIVLSVIMGTITSYLNYYASISTLETSITETAALAGECLSAELQKYRNIAQEAGCVARLSSDSISMAEKESILNQKVDTYNFAGSIFLDLQGKDLFKNTDLSNEEYFKQAIKGNVYISDPVLDKDTHKIITIAAAPVWKDGKSGTTVVGAVGFILNENMLNNLVSSINVGKTGYAYLLNNKGMTIAHKDASKVCVENRQELAKQDTSLTEIADIEKKMTAGESGFGLYTYDGASKIVAYSPVPDTNGWSIGITTYKNEFLNGFFTSIYFILGLVVLFILFGIFVSIRLATGISKPIKQCSDRLALLSQGDLHADIPVVKSKDETGVLAQATQTIITSLKDIVADEVHMLGEMSRGNFRVTPKKEYLQDFLPLKTSILQIIESLNDTLLQINQSSQQVANGSEQVSSGAQALAQGATEQASSIQELSATITEISEKIRNNAEHARSANEKVQQVGTEMGQSNRQMQEMISAMSEISSSSNEIGKIIKTIEDIAFQTNILSLNAAVEAARAGEAGKGFAVVADEVRNLASKSAEASKNTSALIESSLLAVQNGTRIAGETAQSLQTVVKGTKEIAATVDKISSASNEQANSIGQITQGVDQISSVVQTNSATAEESAAASEELSGQAQILKSLVGQFQLKSGDHASTVSPQPAHTPIDTQIADSEKY